MRHDLDRETLEEARYGRLSRTRYCPDCRCIGTHARGCPGTPPEPEEEPCEDCGDTGEVERTIYYAGGEAPMDVPVECHCRHRGRP